jgi:hypothetical protein
MLIVFAVGLLFTSSIAQIGITGSVVKVYTVYNKHRYFRPWQIMGRRV